MAYISMGGAFGRETILTPQLQGDKTDCKAVSWSSVGFRAAAFGMIVFKVICAGAVFRMRDNFDCP